jgi:hypothetical protein
MAGCPVPLPLYFAHFPGRSLFISINRVRAGTKRAILTTPSILRVVGTGLAGVEDGRQLVVKNSPRHRNITVTVR